MPDRVARRVWRKEKSLMTERDEEGFVEEVAFCGSLDKGFKRLRLAQGDVETGIGLAGSAGLIGPGKDLKGQCKGREEMFIEHLLCASPYVFI